MNPLFNAVARTLDWIASVTGFTYNEINIIAYYIVIPFVYVVLLDRIIHKHVLKIAYTFVWVAILVVIRNFSEFCDALFKVSVDFLLMFSAVGLDYVAASVVICVILPALVFAVLLLMAFPKLQRRFSSQNGNQSPV